MTQKFQAHSTRLLRYALCVVLGWPASGVMAQETQNPQDPAPAANNDTTTLQQVGQWWQQSKEVTGQWWDSSRQLLGTLSEQQDNPEFAEVWKKITPTLSEIDKLQAEQTLLPEKSWFSRDQAQQQQSINALLDEAVEILGISETNQIRTKIHALNEAIAKANSQIAQYRQEKISAPTQSKWKTTVEGFDQKIQALEADIRRYQQEIDQLKTLFIQSLERIGVRLTQEQLDLLMSSVVGDDIIQSSIVYANVRQMSEQLMILTEESGENLDITRRYYAMYTVLLKVLLHMQQQFMTKVEQDYLPAIERIASDVQAVRKETEQLLRTADPQRHPHLSANLNAQELTLKASGLYRQHLQEQHAKMQHAYAKTQADLAVAQNTLQTVTLSGELVNLLRTSQDAFGLLLTIEVPELLVFDNTQMKQEFALLTEKLTR
ncbi:hypothetical protein [Thioflexithrix psekupsensis]|uniref:Uncharacterized protein n=1 Tax=Thioflexithrix psekupsensis TaxID=1570016 RepID=A0A251X3W1_9GAMM|nr:hypothetical protein [Thioflexithrix psekupsensis]OUD12076.1 hypothetical protein TPSD3_13165 [Thioflexithrix psekupsensis]